ncbi:MAG TPA: LPXTG cell wall anchor domain-containing protein [Chloroflexota bacterium]|nr:LPXTG cell wall anchor domain-containing protein [Chloroflexota bacterium]
MDSTATRLRSLVAALPLALLPAANAAAQPVALDPALCQPGFADFARRYPNDWYQRLDPAVRPIADVQRTIGLHGLVVGFADEQGNPGYTPRVVVVVAFHDGADLHAAGLPRVWPNGKPVVVLHTPGIPQAAAAPGSPTAQRSAAQLPAGCPAAWAGTAAGQAPGTDQPGPPAQLPRTGAGGAGEFALAGLLLALAGGLLGERRRSHRSPS